MKQFVLKIETFAESDGRKDFVEYPAKWIYLILATIYILCVWIWGHCSSTNDAGGFPKSVGG